jgi:hypothetical protein
MLNGEKHTVLQEPLVSRLACSWKILKTYLSNKLHDTKNTQQRRNDVQRRKEIRSGKKHREYEGKAERKMSLTVTCRMEAIPYSEQE